LVMHVEFNTLSSIYFNRLADISLCLRVRGMYIIVSSLSRLCEAVVDRMHSVLVIASLCCVCTCIRCCLLLLRFISVMLHLRYTSRARALQEAASAMLMVVVVVAL
jgi:hypothetical protein